MKDKLSISLENDDLRKGMVRLDDQYFYAKVVDLPTVVESLKTIDKKSFYKTADVCQMMICKEEPDPVTDDEKRDAQKNKKKDPNKIDKKYLYPHGITPCLKVTQNLISLILKSLTKLYSLSFLECEKTSIQKNTEKEKC